MKGQDYLTSEQTAIWARDEPQSIGDFVARKVVEDKVWRIAKDRIIKVIDIGCGEGYMARRVGLIVKRVTGVDQSKEMIDLAIMRGPWTKVNNLMYVVGDALDLPREIGIFNVAMSNFVYSYFNPKQLKRFYSEISMALDTQGDFVVCGPHPIFYSKVFGEKGMPVETKAEDGSEFDYIQSRGKWFSGPSRLARGGERQVSYCHCTLEDHFSAISDAGLVVTGLEEPVVSRELGERFPIFKKAVGTTPFMVLQGRKVR